MDHTFSIAPISETLLTISFGNSISTEINSKVFKAYLQLQKNKHPSWLDIIPAYSTISIVYDVVTIRQQHPSAFEWVKNQVEKLIAEISEENKIPSRNVRVPVCYAPEFALDAERIMKEKNISFDELVMLHTSKSYHVFMIGFLPGFAYMGSVDSRIAVSRIPTPRTNVSAGSVGIAGEQTGIYPLSSPGGWNIIGKTPLKIFDPAADESVLFRPGDQVIFVPVTRKEFESFDQSTFNLVMDEC